MNQLKWVGFCGVLSLIACSSSSNDGDNGGKLSGSGASAGAAGAPTGGGGASVGGSAGVGVGGTAVAGAAGAGNTAGIDGGSGAVGNADAGTDGSNCDVLFSDYKAALVSAAECTPGAASQCELLVQSNPGCGEYTLVEETNTAALSDLDTLKGQWTASGCSYPCGVGGWGATEAICEPSGGTGYCKVTKN